MDPVLTGITAGVATIVWVAIDLMVRAVAARKKQGQAQADKLVRPATPEETNKYGFPMPPLSWLAPFLVGTIAGLLAEIFGRTDL